MTTKTLPDFAIENVDELVEYLLALEPDFHTPIKIQKGLYFLFGFYSNTYGTSTGEDYQNFPKYLFDANFEAWRLGPVIRDVYDKYKAGEYTAGKSIDAQAEKVFKLSTKEPWRHEVKLFVDQMFLDQVMKTSDFGLVDRSHSDDCWARVYRSGEGQNQPITMESIAENYRYTTLKH